MFQVKKQKQVSFLLENKLLFFEHLCVLVLCQKRHVFFLQHFLDFITKDYVEDLGMIPLEYLQEADVRLVVIGPAPYKFINVSILTLFYMPDKKESK